MATFSFEVLVSLNNAGALLLQRNRFEEAYLTYLDTLHVLENGRISEEQSKDVEASFRCSLQAMLACAAIRLEESRINPQAPYATPACPLSIPAGGQGGGETPVVPPAVPDDQRCIERQESIYLNVQCLHSNELHFDLISAVIIYNFGLCHMKISIVNQNESSYFRQTGESLMKYAYAALPNLPALSDIEDVKSTIAMSVITLSFLVAVCNLSLEESDLFRTKLRIAKEGLSVFAADARIAPAA